MTGPAPGRVIEAGGLRFHIVEAGPADGPPIVLLHGLPEFWWGWRRLIEPLAAGGLRVIVPDLRGFGASDAPPGLESYAPAKLAGDVLAIAGTLKLRRFHLVGHNWGGVLGWIVARRAPERVSRLGIIAAPHPDAMGPDLARHPRQILRSAYIGLFQIPHLPEAILGARDFAILRAAMRRSARAGTFQPADLDRYAEVWRPEGRLTAMLNWYRGLRLARGQIGRVQVPTAILWGDRDRFLGAHLAQASAALCDDAAVHVRPGGTHWLHLEEPRWVLERILA